MSNPLFKFNKKKSEVYIFFDDCSTEFFSLGLKSEEESRDIFNTIEDYYKAGVPDSYKYAHIIKNVIFKYGDYKLYKPNIEENINSDSVRIDKINELRTFTFEFE